MKVKIESLRETDQFQALEKDWKLYTKQPMHQDLVQKYNGFVDTFEKEGKLTGPTEFWESNFAKETTKLMSLISDVADGELVSFFDYILDDQRGTTMSALTDEETKLGCKNVTFYKVLMVRKGKSAQGRGDWGFALDGMKGMVAETCKQYNYKNCPTDSKIAELFKICPKNA